MTVMVSNQQNLQPINSAQLVGVFKAIAPRSFEKTFDGMPAEAINNAMKICIEGLSRDEINAGLRLVRDNGFCPDPAMFRKWCLGIVGFGTEQQRLQDTFKGKHAALANIIKWLSDNNHKITNAEKESYDRCYEMFQAISWATNVDRANYLAYEAFKDNYADVIQEFAQAGVTQGIWESDLCLEASVGKSDLYKPMPKPYGLKRSPEQEAWVEKRTKELESEGLSFPKALWNASKEYAQGDAA